MPALLRLALAVLVLLAAACGTRTETAPAPTPAATEAADAARAAPRTPDPSPSVVEDARPLLYVALGDSLASGAGGTDSYVDVFRDELQAGTGRPVTVTNLGRPGWTSSQLLEALRSNDRFRTAVATADVVTWDIGGNDLLGAAFRYATGTCGGEDGQACLDDTRRGFERRWAAIVDELRALRRDDDVTLLTFDLYEPLGPVHGDERAAVAARLDAFNAVIHASATHDGVAVAPVAEAFRGEESALVSGDGVHPSPQGHRRIAELLAELAVVPSG